MSESGQPASRVTPVALSAALKRLLRPLARLMIRHGLTLPGVVEVFKQVLVEVADTQYPVDGKRTTDSRISVLTGVHRKDVKRIRTQDEHAPVPEQPRKLALGARLVNAWLNEAPWIDSQGNPCPLPRSAEHAPGSFDALANALSNDVRPRAVLDELMRTGIVTLNEAGEVELARHAYVPAEDEDEKLVYFEQSNYAHLMAGVENLEGHQPAHFDRVVHYQHIPAGTVETLREEIDAEGMALLKKINSKARRARKPNAGGGQRIYLGVYFYTEPDHDQ